LAGAVVNPVAFLEEPLLKRALITRPLSSSLSPIINVRLAGWVCTSIDDSVAAAAWVTVTVLAIPLPITDIVPVLWECNVFASADIVKVPSPLPLILLVLSQDTLLEIVQATLLITLIKGEVPPVAAGLKLLGDTDSADAVCVTVILLNILPATTSIVALLWEAPVLGAAVMLNVSFPLPLDLFTVAQDWLDKTTLHDVLL